jgi:sugar O-acyltransferase (sialic acid O-acetyltransferase NeuD family)
MQELILLGAGGHCASVIDVIESTNMYRIIGILDNNKERGTQVLGYEVLGDDEQLHKFGHYSNVGYVVSIGQIKSPTARINIATLLEKLPCPVIVSPHAYVSPHAAIGRGSIVMHHACVNANVRIGDFNIINTKANIEHDVTVGSYCHISTGAIINGNCKIEDGSFIGSNATIKQGLVVQQNSIVGAGIFLK